MLVEGVRIEGNTASGAAADQGGGGLFNAGGILTVKDESLILNNIADGAAGSGGGILNDAGGILVVENTTLTGNSAIRAGGGIEDNSGALTPMSLMDVNFLSNTTGGSPGNGGALHITGPGDADIRGGRVVGNRAAAEGGGFWNGSGRMTVSDVFIDANTASGDAADQGGGGLFNLSGILTVQEGTTVANNRANGTAGSGGGILNDVGGTLIVSKSSICGNTAMRAGGGIEDNSGAGTTMMLSDVSLMRNLTGSAPGNGGGLHITGPGDAEINGGEVSGNFAAAEGGGLWNGTGSMTVIGTIIKENIASGAPADQGGGGIFNAGGSLTVQGWTMIANNLADGASGSGGGVFNDAGGSLTVMNTTIEGNSATRAGGGIEDNSGAETTIMLNNVELRKNDTGPAPGNGGGLHITGPGNATIIGGMVVGNEAAAEGGGLWNGTGTMTVDGTVVRGNDADGDPADQGGGGLFNAGGTLIVEGNSFIQNNTARGAAGSGGGIFNDVGGMLTVRNSSLSGNQAMRAGGGIEDNSGAETTILLENVELVANETGPSPGNGGGLHITGPGNATITGGMIKGNVAATEGGGLWNGSGTMTVSNAIVRANRASGDAADQGGGGLFNLSGTLIVDQNTIVSGNIADGAAGSGGGILNDAGGILMVSNTNVFNNTSMRAGGGIEDNSGAGTTVVLNEVLIRWNMTGGAPGNGGGVHITGPGLMEVNGGMVDGNTATAEGGGLWNGSGTMTLNNVMVSENTATGNGPDQGGGGLFNAGGTLEVLNTTVANNQVDGAGNGGGIHNDAGGSLIVMGSTISGNASSNDGGGVANIGTFTLGRSTIADNMAATRGGGIFQMDAMNTTTLRTSLVATNRDNGTGVDLAGMGTFNSSGFNLIGVDAAGLLAAQASDKVGTATDPIDPLLGNLATNGGTTMTHALRCGSPAIDMGDPAVNAPDQRGEMVFGGQRDIGAYEVQMMCPGLVSPGTFDPMTPEGMLSGVVFPNPARRGMIQLQVRAEIGTTVRVRVLEVASGKRVLEQQVLPGQNELDLSSVSAGIYLVELQTDTQQSTQRLVLTR